MDINLYTWFTERELDFCPKHFIATNTPVDTEKKLWILEKLNGRFYLGIKSKDFLMSEQYPYFEDPQEAVYYELTWS